MYIPLSFMGGSGVVASCNCRTYQIQTTVSTGSIITYKPCNAESLVVETLPSGNFSTSYCVGDGIISYTNTLEIINAGESCIQSNCQSCECYDFFYRTSIDPFPHYFSYIPCNQPASAVQIAGPFQPLTTGSLKVSFPWTIKMISGGFDTNINGPTGFIKLTTSESCAPFVSGTVEVGDLRGGGRVLYVTGSYPNQSGLIVATSSVATSSLNMSRWGFLGTETDIENRSYGAGPTNTAALRNYIPATGSIMANTFTASINGYNDWFLPSTSEALSSSLNHIVWPDNVVFNAICRDCQPLIYQLLGVSGSTSFYKIPTSVEKYDGTAAQRREFFRIVTQFHTEDDRNKNVTGEPFYAYRYFTSSLVT
jgi:hypothetical protein